MQSSYHINIFPEENKINALGGQMKRKAMYAIFAIVFAIIAMLFGCSETDPEPEPEPEYDSFEFFPTIDNTSIESAVIEDTVPIASILTESSDSLFSGDTVETRVITFAGTIPTFSRARGNFDIQSETETIHLSADGGTCMNSGPWNAESTFVIGIAQTVSLSYYSSGIMCLGYSGFSVYIKNSSGTTVYMRERNQGIGVDIDTLWGTLDLTPDTYTLHISTVTGTHTNASLTYTPGGTGGVGATLVVYHNGNLYPVSEASPGAYYSHVVDLFNGSNTIRVLIVGNFDPAAQADLANILGASDLIDLFCITDDMAIRAVLSWQIDDSDVDLHLIAPNGQVFSSPSDCYFSNKTPNWGDSTETLDDPILDHDNTSGYGPETTVLPLPANGLYTVLIHYWSDHGGGNAPSTVVVTLNESSSRTFGPRVLVDDEYWIVTGINVSGGTASFASAPDSTDLFPSSFATWPTK